MKKGLYNIVFGVGGQFIILALGIVVPRFVLHSYGDEANGLMNAIGQLFTYIALIEAGVGQAALQELYGPVVKKEREVTNNILYATQVMYRKLTYIYIVVVFLIATFYPMFIRVNDATTISFFGSTYWAVFFIVLLQGISNAITFYFVATLRQILIADGCNYIIVNISTLIRVATSVARIILINMQVNLVVLQLVYVFLNIIEVIIYKKIFCKRYEWINLQNSTEKFILKQRGSFVVHEICNVIFSSTDILILSMFCSLESASIYAIYNLVFSALNQLISQIHSGCFYVLGQTFSVDKNKYIKVHDAYDTYYIAFVFSIMSTAYMLILPFIKLYTDGVTDLQYVDFYLPLLFSMVQILSCCRITSSNLIKLAGHARATVSRAILEALINLGVSLLLVNWIGIYGVLIGTIIAMLYRTNDMIIYANKRILNRSSIKTYKMIAINIVLFIISMVISKFIEFKWITDFLRFFLVGAGIYIISFIVYIGINSLIDKESSNFLFHKIKMVILKKIT